jgi:hypothetical protein
MRRRYVIGLCVCILTGLVLLALTKRDTKIVLANGSFVRIIPPSLLLGDGNARIWYQPTGLPAGEIVVLQDSYDRPITVIAGPNSSVILCLYEFDVDLRLFKIDPSRKFKPFPSDSALNAIVRKSPWEVEPATIDDWHYAHTFLAGLPSKTFRRQSVPVFNYGLFRLHLEPQLINERMANQISQMPIVPTGE